MKNSLISSKRLQLSVLFGLLFAITVSMVRFDGDCRELRENILRLHIIANSDSAEDQRVKLAVRDEILKRSDAFFENGMTLREAEEAVTRHLPDLQAAANGVLAAQGKGYTAVVSVEDSFFETREYEDFTLPAGIYRSVMVRIGEAKGKNWWCVVFPALCVPAASPDARLRDAVSEDAAEVASRPERYKMRFKIVEVFEDFKNFFRKK